MRHLPVRSLGLLSCGLFLAVLGAGPAAPATVQQLRIQKVGDIIYFHVRLELPKEMLRETRHPDWGNLGKAATDPRLVAPADQLRLVCQRRQPRARWQQPWMDERGRRTTEARDGFTPRAPVPVEGLEFVGQTRTRGKVTAKLLYVVDDTTPSPTWKETEVVLDFRKAHEVAIPAEAGERRKERKPDRFQRPVRDDLEGLWAVAQAEQFSDLNDHVQEFGFYGFAAAATLRKYHVRWNGAVDASLALRGFRGQEDRGDFINRELYETTTGAAAIAESLQLRRMNRVDGRESEKRTVPISKVRGIDIAEHPWEKMIGTKKPAPEPFARLIPHDNYYVHFKRIDRFLDFAALLDQWGTNLTRAYEATSRDHRLRERYEQQLCLGSTPLSKTLGPLVIQGVAITGNDLYLREGSDVAVLFRVSQPKVFLAAVAPFLAEARKKHGTELQERKTAYHGVAIESFVTPLREVSLHRARVDDFVIYANSPVGIRRILDAYQGRGKRLSDSLDFQYMRTVFRHDDRHEDGFAFLSDAFIRNLVGPASKIKERRRLEALTSLHMLTHAALYTAWQTGTVPASQAQLMQAAGLERDDVPMPEGSPGYWDAKKHIARSDAYNTLHFATPLIELPMVNVTPTEAAEYERFRLEYLGLWRQYFDPIGMRLAFSGDRAQLDTYILPLIENSQYNELRRVTGSKSIRFDPASISSKTLAQFVLRLSGDAGDRAVGLGLLGFDRAGGGLFSLQALARAALDPVGDWFLLRMDDSPVYEKLLALAQRSRRGESVETHEIAKLVWSLPLAMAVDIRNPLTFAATLTGLRTSVQTSLPGVVTWAPLEKPYRGVSIVRVQATPAGRARFGLGLGSDRDDKDVFLPTIYYALLDRGFYLTLNEETMRGLIDGALAKRDGKATVEVASSLYLAPKAAQQARGFVRRLLEQQTHQQAQTSLPIWYALYRTGVVADGATTEQARESAYRYLGFVPVSPDGTAYRYDKKYDEVVNERHGSRRKPTLHTTTAADSPLNFLVEQLRSLRADLRFREDGIHTVLTLERGKAEK